MAEFPRQIQDRAEREWPHRSGVQTPGWGCKRGEHVLSPRDQLWRSMGAIYRQMVITWRNTAHNRSTANDGKSVKRRPAYTIRHHARGDSLAECDGHRCGGLVSHAGKYLCCSSESHAGILGGVNPWSRPGSTFLTARQLRQLSQAPRSKGPRESSKNFFS